MKYLTILVFLTDLALAFIPCIYLGCYVVNAYSPLVGQNPLTAVAVSFVYGFVYTFFYRFFTRPIFRAYMQWYHNKMWERTIRNIDITLIELKKEYGDARRTQRNLSGRIDAKLTPGDPSIHDN